MAQSWRINVQEVSLGAVANPRVGNIGATVIRASKGPVKPIKISRGGEQRILNIFGKPSASYPDVWDAIEYNKKADLWVSAPSKSGLYSGVLVTKTGTKALTSGLSTLTSLDFSALPVEQTIGTGDGSTAAFIFTLTDKTYYVNQSIDIEVDGVSINVTASDASTEILTTTPNVGSGTYVRSTGVLTFTFLTPPTNNQVVTATYTTDRSAEVYFGLFSIAPQANDLAVQISMASSVFTVNAYQKDSNSNYIELPNSPYSVSLTANTKNGFGENIYLVDTFTDDDYITPVIGTLALSTFTNDSAKVDFAGGYRGVAPTITEWTAGWAYFQNPNTYAADIFFDCTADAGIPAIFSTLRNTYQKYKAYLLPLPNTAYATAITNKSSLSTSDRGIYFYYNWGKARDTYNNSYLWSPLMGRIAGKHADMVDVYNGLAPCWIDENGHGGQLGSGIVEMAYDLSEGALEALDDAQINPVIFDPQYGVMIVSDRTSQTTLNDYSYIPHSRVADYCISNVISQALPYQLVKLNDITHRTIVKSKIDLITGPLTNPQLPLLAEAGTQCDEFNNDAAARSRREFICTTFVKFTPFSEKIKFTFTAVDQSVSVQELIGG